MMSYRFEHREDAGLQLAARLHDGKLVLPLVLAIPRGGVEVAAPLARALRAELDVVLSRKLRAPGQPELAVGAVSESGEVYLNHFAGELTEALDGYVEHEVALQLAEIERLSRLFRKVRPKAAVTGRSVIVTDDGIATGATMIAALHTVRAEDPCELIVAVPVAPRDRLVEIRAWADLVLCLHVPFAFRAVGQYYRSFTEVGDERVEQLLRDFARVIPDGSGPDSGAHASGGVAAGPRHGPCGSEAPQEPDGRKP